MNPGELRPAVNVDDELERDRLVRRKRRAAAAIQNLLNTTAYYNRLHPNHSPIPYDDAAGSLGQARSTKPAAERARRPTTTARTSAT